MQCFIPKYKIGGTSKNFKNTKEGEKDVAERRKEKKCGGRERAGF